MSPNWPEWPLRPATRNIPKKRLLNHLLPADMAIPPRLKPRLVRVVRRAFPEGEAF